MNTSTAASIEQDTLEIQPLLPESSTPLLVTPRADKPRALDVFPQLEACVEHHLLECGALLFRGFELDGAEEFQYFATAFGHPLLEYDFASTPRRRVRQGVYSSTEYPAHQSIPLHNEQSYGRAWPMKIWFYCSLPARIGGETPVADSREVYRLLPPRIRERFAERELSYVRNFGNGLDLPWTRVFNTERRDEVEAYCRAHGIACEWKPDGELRTKNRAQAVAAHPRTGEAVWFNQAHLFHVSALEPDMREALVDAVGEHELPRNVYYGDGTPIEESILEEVRAVLESAKRVFAWQQGDVLMLDNMLTAHARMPFQGDRKVIVAMSEPHETTHQRVER